MSLQLESREFSSELLREFSPRGSRTDNTIFLLEAIPYIYLPERSFMYCYQSKVLATHCSKADVLKMGVVRMESSSFTKR